MLSADPTAEARRLHRSQREMVAASVLACPARDDKPAPRPA
jgi:hypothetical protein